MSDPEPQQILVAISFADQYRASEFLTAATRLNAEGHLAMKDAIFLVKREDGKVHVQETIDPKPSQAALSTGLWSALFGLLLGGPVGLLIGGGVGAGAGAVTAKVLDLGIPDEWVSWLRAAVQPGTVTLALLVTDIDRPAFLAELRRFEGAHLVYGNLPPDLLERAKAALAGTDQEAGIPAGASAPPPTPLAADAGPGTPPDLPPPAAT